MPSGIANKGDGLPLEVHISAEQLEQLAELIARKVRLESLVSAARHKPLYTLPQLAELIGVHERTWQRVMKNYPGYFTKVGATPVIRASRLEELLEAAEGDKLFTTEMSQAAKARLKGNRNAQQKGKPQGPR